MKYFLKEMEYIGKIILATVLPIFINCQKQQLQSSKSWDKKKEEINTSDDLEAENVGLFDLNDYQTSCW